MLYTSEVAASYVHTHTQIHKHMHAYWVIQFASSLPGHRPDHTTPAHSWPKKQTKEKEHFLCLLLFHGHVVTSAAVLMCLPVCANCLQLRGIQVWPMLLMSWRTCDLELPYDQCPNHNRSHPVETKVWSLGTRIQCSKFNLELYLYNSGSSFLYDLLLCVCAAIGFFSPGAQACVDTACL